MGERLKNPGSDAEFKELERADNYDSAVTEILEEYRSKTAFEREVMQDIIIGEKITKDTILEFEKRNEKTFSSEDIKRYFEHFFNDGMNCGGFALEVFGCLFTHTNNLNNATKLILETFPFVRLQNSGELGPNEYRVLYRHQDGGFSHHFVKEENGKLIEKDGNGPVQDFTEWSDSLKDAPEVTLIVDRDHDIQMIDEDGIPKTVFGI